VEVIRALGELGDPQVAPALIEQVDRMEAETTRQALIQIGVRAAAHLAAAGFSAWRVITPASKARPARAAENRSARCMQIISKRRRVSGEIRHIEVYRGDNLL
jgi:hypothetical protein